MDPQKLLDFSFCLEDEARDGENPQFWIEKAVLNWDFRGSDDRKVDVSPHSVIRAEVWPWLLEDVVSPDLADMCLTSLCLKSLTVQLFAQSQDRAKERVRVPLLPSWISSGSGGSFRIKEKECPVQHEPGIMGASLPAIIMVHLWFSKKGKR
jgi:hypothetical protein